MASILPEHEKTAFFSGMPKWRIILFIAAVAVAILTFVWLFITAYYHRTYNATPFGLPYETWVWIDFIFWFGSIIAAVATAPKSLSSH